MLLLYGAGALDEARNEDREVVQMVTVEKEHEICTAGEVGIENIPCEPEPAETSPAVWSTNIAR